MTSITRVFNLEEYFTLLSTARKERVILFMELFTILSKIPFLPERIMRPVRKVLFLLIFGTGPKNKGFRSKINTEIARVDPNNNPC